MCEEIQYVAVSVMTHIFETMFFIFLEPEGENGKSSFFWKPSQPLLKGEIGFRGNYSGRLKFYLPLGLAKTMASYFMGVRSEEVSDFQAVDTVNELCNMVCGNLFSQMDKKSVWDLAIPQTHQISNEEWERDMKGSNIKMDFDAEGQPIRLIIQIDSEGIQRTEEG